MSCWSIKRIKTTSDSMCLCFIIKYFLNKVTWKVYLQTCEKRSMISSAYMDKKESGYVTEEVDSFE